MDKLKGKKGKKSPKGGASVGDLEVKKAAVKDLCTPVKVTEGSIYQLLREVLGPAFMSFRGK
jgi:hypothetical protein